MPPMTFATFSLPVRRLVYAPLGAPASMNNAANAIVHCGTLGRVLHEDHVTRHQIRRYKACELVVGKFHGSTPRITPSGARSMVASPDDGASVCGAGKRSALAA